MSTRRIFALVAVLLLPTIASAASVDLPPAGCPANAPWIDGRWDAGEWDQATYARFDMNLPGGRTAPAAVFVMNDARYLYVAIQFERSSLDDVHHASVMIDADNSDGGPSPNDDRFGFYSDRISNFSVVDDESAYLGGGCRSTCFASDVKFGGGVQVQWAVGNDGALTTYELAHPLNGGEGQDVNVTAGATIGLEFAMRVAQAGAGYADTVFPGYSGEWARYTVTRCR